MSLLAPITLTRRRYGAQTVSRGVVTPGATTTATFDGSVQPMKGKEREIYLEGQRTKDGRKIYTLNASAVRAADPDSGTAADEVQIDGAWFTVVHVDTSHALIEHAHIYVVRRPETVSA